MVTQLKIASDTITKLVYKPERMLSRRLMGNSMFFISGEWGYHSGESTSLSPMRSRFDSQTQVD